MSDMWDKLGDLLNDALKSDNLTIKNIEKDQNSSKMDVFDENSGLFFDKKSQNNQNTEKKSKKLEEKIRNILQSDNESIGEVIKDSNNYKMHKYTKLMHIPCIVSKSLYTLDIVCINNLTVKKLRQQYHILLKENHPDTSRVNEKLKSPEELKKAYEIVKSYFFDK